MNFNKVIVFFEFRFPEKLQKIAVLKFLLVIEIHIPSTVQAIIVRLSTQWAISFLREVSKNKKSFYLPCIQRLIDPNRQNLNTFRKFFPNNEQNFPETTRCSHPPVSQLHLFYFYKFIQKSIMVTLLALGTVFNAVADNCEKFLFSLETNHILRQKCRLNIFKKIITPQVCTCKQLFKDQMLLLAACSQKYNCDKNTKNCIVSQLASRFRLYVLQNWQMLFFPQVLN